MAEGRLSFRWEKVQISDYLGAGIRILCLAGIGASIILTAKVELRQVPISDGVLKMETGLSVEPTE